MSISYKPALLKALLCIVQSEPELEILLEAIRAEFWRLYSARRDVTYSRVCSSAAWKAHWLVLSSR